MSTLGPTPRNILCNHNANRAARARAQFIRKHRMHLACIRAAYLYSTRPASSTPGHTLLLYGEVSGVYVPQALS